MSKVETRKFDAEIGKVLNLMIHSLYTNKDIFLRELISNASDAFDKLRFEASKKDDLLDGAELKITISVDEDNRLLIIRDNGIGMSKQELIENLGTIAKSGTQKFLEQLTGDNRKDVELIGQFGVGFYSGFMVAEEITVNSKKAQEDTACTWRSKGDGEFTISELKDDKFTRGTEIVLKLKEGEEEYLDQFKIGHIINTYSDHISVPVEFLAKEKEPTILNSSSALWTKQKSEITEESYNEFYKKISSLPDKPWMTMHNKNEGAVEYTNLLFIPSTKTYDLFHPDRKRSVKLYIKKVFINDEGIDIIPQYLRFLRGIIDSQDLPLNISRETLQHNKVLGKIKTSITNKVLSELEKTLNKERDSYIEFWNNFGSALKEGLCEYTNNHEKILDICLFKSMKLNSYITLKEYIDNMPATQDSIYYISGNDEESLKNHPQLEGFQKNGIDVLLFTDSVDNFWVNVANQYKEKNIKSVTRSDIDLSNKDESTDAPEKTNAEEYADLIKFFKDSLKDSVKDVRISKKLTDSPVCLATSEGAMDIRMERFLADQKQIKLPSAKILEINPNHKIVRQIFTKITNQSTTDQTKNLIRLLFDQACILEGEPVQNVVDFSKRMNEFLVTSDI